MHGAWQAAASAAAAAACMHACVRGRLRDRHHNNELTLRRRPRRGESNFRIEISEINGCGQKGEFGGLPPELALLSTSINLEYFYTEIRFSTPDLSALLSLAGQISLS